MTIRAMHFRRYRRAVAAVMFTASLGGVGCVSARESNAVAQYDRIVRQSPELARETWLRDRIIHAPPNCIVTLDYNFYSQCWEPYWEAPIMTERFLDGDKVVSRVIKAYRDHARPPSVSEEYRIRDVNAAAVFGNLLRILLNTTDECHTPIDKRRPPGCELFLFCPGATDKVLKPSGDDDSGSFLYQIYCWVDRLECNEEITDPDMALQVLTGDTFSSGTDLLEHAIWSFDMACREAMRALPGKPPSGAASSQASMIPVQ